MFNFWKRKRTADEEKEAEMRLSIAKKLENYTAPNEDSQDNFTEFDFGEGTVQFPKINIESPFELEQISDRDDCWAQADKRDTTNWINDEQQA